MNYKDMVKKAKHLDIKYDCMKNDICLLIKTDDGEFILGTLTDVDVWQNDKGEYGLDLISEEDRE